MLATVPPPAKSQEAPDAFTQAQYQWAVNWINGPLETLMAHSVIKNILSADNTFLVRAGEAWEQLSFSQAGELITNLSRARKITGHSPFFSIEHDETGAVLGRVTQTSITLLVPGEGYFDYISSMHDSKTTHY